ncbi:MAG TPA: ECF transporter S component [Chloroflexia bacterium]|nr:ECF transporter S component [Chloroflexia bacterium]
MAQVADAGAARRARLWAIGKREAIAMTVGALLYGFFGWATSGLRIPGPFDSQIRPGVVIPLFFGAAFGPVVGFITGSVGNMLIDWLGRGEIFWNWAIGNGIMGLVAGLAANSFRRLDSPRAIGIAVVYSVLGVLAGMGFAAVTDIWGRPQLVHGPSDIWGAFYPVAVSNSIAAIVLVPLLCIAYESARTAWNQAGT